MSARTFLMAAAALVVASAAPSHAGTTGKIAGRVRDAGSSQPVASATVLAEGTRFGAVSDENGQFFILNLPPGDYTLSVHALGFADAKQTAVHVTVDFTTSVDFQVNSVVAATTPTVSVAGKRPVVQKDVMTTARIVREEEIRHSPSRGYLGIVAQQSGVVEFSNYNAFQIGATERSSNPILVIRGGRPEEVGYYVDGFDQKDLQSGLTTTRIPNSALSEIVVMPGGFAAEYGQNLSGVVNVATKEGGETYSGSFEVVTDNLAGDWVGSHRYDQNIYGASLGGPLFPGRRDWTFFGALERGWSRDWSPSPVAGGQLPGNSMGSWTWSGKMLGRLSKDLELRLGSTGNTQDWFEYRNAYRFDIEHAPRYRDQSKTFWSQLTHTIDERTYQTLAVGLFSTDRTRGDATLFEDLEAYGSNGSSGNPGFDPGEGLFLYGTGDDEGAHIYNNLLRRHSSYWGLDWDAARQLDSHHLVKVGLDVQRHTLRYYEHLIPTSVYEGSANPYVDVQSYGYDSTGFDQLLDEGLDGVKHPLAVGAFVQDKFEVEGLIVQPGLRFDYFDSRALRIKDESNPLDDASQLTADRLEESRPSKTIAPRLGIGIPVDDDTHLHVNYGQFFQQPNLAELYTNYSYVAYKIRTGGYYYPFGNPNLEPGKTTAYEVGVTRRLSPASKIELSAYFKDIRGLSQVATVPSSPNQFASYRNIDYGTAKGIDLTASTERINRFRGSMSYSLGFSEGTGSISNTNRNIAWTSSETPKQTAPLAFDQRHKLSGSADYRLRHGEGPRFLGCRPLAKTGLNVLLAAASGLPYTPSQVYNEVTLNSVTSVPAGPINSRRAPWTLQVDMKLDRDFNVGFSNLNAFVWVVNVFDRMNPVLVYSSTGLPDETGWLSTSEGQSWLESNGAGANERYDLAQNNPRNFATPRVVRFGVKTSF